MIEAIFKEPVTAGDFSKASARGIPVVYNHRLDGTGSFYVKETLDPDDLNHSYCEFRKVFNGELLVDEDFETIRKRVRERDWI